MNLTPIIILAIGGIILAVGDIVMKQWVVKNQPWYFGLGLLVWLIGNIFLGLSFRYKNIAIASAIFVVFNIVTLSIVSWLYFKEGLSPIQMVGIVLALISVIILSVID